MSFRSKGRFRPFLHCFPVIIVATLGLLFAAAVISTALITKNTMAELRSANGPQAWFTFTNMKGFFLQDEAGTDPAKVGFADPNMGLITRSYPTDQKFDPSGKRTQWERFANYVRNLNSTAPKGTSYKIMFLGRHGEGWHNVEEADVGGKLWDCYWSRLDGNGNITWANAELTPLGIQQALAANSWWKTALRDVKIPAPESYYVSPLQRTLHTSNLTFSGLDLPSDKQFKPVIKEKLREAIGVHTCDRRSTKTEIHSLWPAYAFEGNFSETDNLWDPNYRENGGEQIFRMNQLLDDIFAHDRNTFVSGTSHGGAIGSLLYGVGHLSFSLNTGDVVPIFLKGERHEGPRPTPKIDPPAKNTICATPTG